MSEPITWILAGLAGMGLGLFYFVGLWFTVRHLPSLQRPGFVLLVSFFLRNVLTLAGFYLVMRGSWERLLAALLGFLLVRTILIARWKPAALPVPPAGSEALP